MPILYAETAVQQNDWFRFFPKVLSRKRVEVNEMDQEGFKSRLWR